MHNCAYCEKPIDKAAETFAGQPIHPECLVQLGADLDAAFPLDRIEEAKAA